jgi:hypothetical protein
MPSFVCNEFKRSCIKHKISVVFLDTNQRLILGFAYRILIPQNIMHCVKFVSEFTFGDLLYFVQYSLRY